MSIAAELEDLINRRDTPQSEIMRRAGIKTPNWLSRTIENDTADKNRDYLTRVAAELGMRIVDDHLVYDDRVSSIIQRPLSFANHLREMHQDVLDFFKGEAAIVGSYHVFLQMVDRADAIFHFTVEEYAGILTEWNRTRDL